MKKSRKHVTSDITGQEPEAEIRTSSSPPNQVAAPIAARHYLARGFAPIPIPSESKAPSIKAWPEFRVTAAEVRSHFKNGGNVGLLLGEASGGLVDVDIDADDGLEHATQFFPKTDLVSGRKSRPHSHLWFRSRVERTIQFQHEGQVLVEIRSTGAQTLVAPSRHPDGERIRWSDYGEPAEIEQGDLRSRAAALASAIVLGRSWPKEGQRNAAALAVAGLLLQRGVRPARVRRIIATAARIAGDEEALARERAVASTMKKLGAKKPVAGETSARKLLGDVVITDIGRWLAEAATPDVSPSTDSVASTASSKADRVITLADDIRLFSCSTDGGQAYGSVTIDGRKETWRLRSTQMRGFLEHRYYRTYRKAPGRSAIDDAVSVLIGQALHANAAEPVAVRVAEAGGTLYIDLADPARHVVAVTPDGWTITQTHPINFVRPGAMTSLPTPKRGGDLDALRRFVNVETDSDWRLLVTWLICAFHPSGPYAVLSISGGQGSAKSTLSEFFKSLSDPDLAKPRSAPRNPRDLAIAAQGNHVLALDNLSSVSREFSDALCRLSTGGSFATRRLYSDDEETLFNATRPVILNGIPDLLGQPDLLDRAIHFVLPRIEESKRRDIERLRDEFKAARPMLFGAILDALTGVVRHLPEVKIDRLPRMADFARWGVALELHLGRPQGEFMRAYVENRRATSIIALDENVLVKPIKYLLKSRNGRFEGTASSLLHALNLLPYAWIQELRRNPDWPRKPNRLSAELRRIGPYLAEAGIKFERGRDGTDSTRQRFIVLSRLKRHRPSKRVAESTGEEMPPLVILPKGSVSKSKASAESRARSEHGRSTSKRHQSKPKRGSR